MQVSTAEAKNKLGRLPAGVARGEEIIVTPRGIPIAKPVPPAPAFDKDRARRATGMRKRSRGTTLGERNPKDLIDEARGKAPEALRR